MQVRPLEKISAIVLFSILVFTGCRKPEESTQSKADLITAAPWKFSEAGIDQNNDGTIDIPLPDGTLDDCATDNLLTFAKNFSGMVDEGATKCDTTTPQSVPFTWKFVDEESAIEFSQVVIPGLDGVANIEGITENQLSLSQNATIPGLPFKLTVVVVLVH